MVALTYSRPNLTEYETGILALPFGGFFMVYSVQELDVKYFVKVRCSTDAKQTFLTWTGAIYSFVPEEQRKRLFKIIGMNVGRCIPNPDGSWEFTSRELTYYLDPSTGEILRTWENPWTGETVPVIHVANKLVQGHLKGTYPAEMKDDITALVFNLFPSYPNPLSEEKFAEYSPNPTYQAAELFKFIVPTQELLDPETVSISQPIISWDRIGPWLPWMKMGNKPGYLIYSAWGSKVESFTELPQLLQDEMNTRVPLYKNAPESSLDDEDFTSWSYFKAHFEEYLRGDDFPIPEPEQESSL
jgi:hypothetical protein